MDVSYKVDMVKMRLKIHNNVIQAIFDRTREDVEQFDYYESRSLKKYRHVWKVEQPSGATFAVMYRHNMEKPNSHSYYWLAFEYNPQKVEKMGILESLVSMATIENPSKVEIVSADIAVDIPVHMDYVRAYRKGKARKLTYEEGNGKTIYFGMKSSDNYLKIYDKQAERKSKGVQIEVTTRLEVSHKVGKPLTSLASWLPSDIIHDIYIIPQQVQMVTGEPITAMYQACLLAVENEEMTIQQFNRRTGNKIRELLERKWTRFNINPIDEKSALMEHVADWYKRK